MDKFRDKLNKSKFVWTTEVGPPKGTDLEPLFSELEYVKGKVDAVNVTDQQSAIMRMGSVAVSKAIIDKGFEPICQFTTRDRNRIALQSDIISAYTLGVRNILIMTGDHPVLGDHPGAKPVYDLDSISLIDTARKLTEGHDLAGRELKGRPELFIGGVVNPGADPLEPEIIKMDKKIRSGAVFFQTQAVFNPNVFIKFIDAIKTIRGKAKILGGIVPLKSARMAVYMNDNIPGVVIPEEIIKRMEKTKDVEKESVDISLEILDEIKDHCDGIHFMPIKANHLVARILERV